MRYVIASVLAVLTVGLFMACSSDESVGSKTTAATSAAGGSGGFGGAMTTTSSEPPPPTVCETETIATIPFDSEGPYGILRHDVAEDFTLPLRDGSSWQFADEYSGCESYIFLTSARVNSGLDSTSIWERDIDQLIQKSPVNVQYFFVAARSIPEAEGELSAVRGKIDEALAALEPDAAASWAKRLHVVGKHYTELEGWVSTLIGGQGRGGFAIDRAQQIRMLGNFADVKRYKQALSDAMKWPWEANLSYAAYEAQHFNYEADREAYLAGQQSPTIVTPWKGEVLKGTVETDLVLPSKAEMAAFDTLELDLTMDCADPKKAESGNCGAWDYLVHLRLFDEGSMSWKELARFITTYHREGRYLVDVTPMLVLLREGGTRKIQLELSPPWNEQAYLTQLDFRFTNQAKGYAPSQASYLFSGGNFNSTYNDGYQPVDVAIPAGAKRVELWAIITGHGMKTNNCAEFCNHQHEFTVNGKVHLREHATVGQNMGCVGEVANGMVPNQGGTWWYGRGGWCPGQQVEPWVVDVTADVTAGQTATVSYQGLLKTITPPDDAGNIVMISYLVIYE